MTKFRLSLLIGCVVIVGFNNQVHSFVRDAQGVKVAVTDYGIRGQRMVLAEVGFTAQDLVSKGIYPIKLSITNKSSEVVTFSPGSLGLAQLDHEYVFNKVGGLSVRHIAAIIGGVVFAGYGLVRLHKGLVKQPENKGINVGVSAFSTALSLGLFGYAWAASKQLKEKLEKSLHGVIVKEMISVEPGATVDWFIFIDQTTYNTINMINLTVTKGGKPLAFLMPLD